LFIPHLIKAKTKKRKKKLFVHSSSSTFVHNMSLSEVSLIPECSEALETCLLFTLGSGGDALETVTECL
jgi:hypothetical protein